MTEPRRLLSPYPVTPWAELGIGDTRVPTGQARWDSAVWAGPGASGYLTPTVGQVTTPDPGPLPSEWVLVWKARGPVISGGVSSHAVVGQWELDPGKSWRVRRHETNLSLFYGVSTAGTTATETTRTLTYGAASGADEWAALAVDRDVGSGNQRLQLYRSTNGAVWTTSGAPQTSATLAPFDASSVLRVGAVQGAVDVWDGRIYSVEARTGLNPAAGTVLWRFDANDYPGTGLSYVDPRGRTWTMTAAGAITPQAPAYTNAGWASTEPTFLDVSCEVHGAHSDNGRERVTERFRPGTADLTLRNESGWADLKPEPSPPATLSIRPGRALRYGVDTPTGRHVLWRGFVDEAVPEYHPYGTDVVQLNGVDALGDVARVTLAKLAAPAGAGDTASARVNRILDAMAWPAVFRDVAPTATTLLATELGASVADLLGVTADSAGGAVFGDLLGRVAFRPRDWQTYLPTTPPAAIVGNIDPDAVCPSTWELSWRRRDVAATVTMGRTDDVAVTVTDAVTQSVIGPEPFTRGDLLTAELVELDRLARRVLVTRGLSTVPRVEAVTLDAARDPGDGSVVELMATARPETPTRLRCQLAARDGRTVFDADMFVTGVEHSIDDRGRWLARFTLDVAAPYAAVGGRWDQAGWDRAMWADAVALLAEAQSFLTRLEVLT